MKRRVKKKRGFTLVELLVVIAIIGLLVSMVVINITHAKAKSRDARRVSDINNIAIALALYHNDNNTYPAYNPGGTLTGSDPVSTALRNAGLISAVPRDPLDQDASGCGAADGYHYYYRSVDSTDYILWYCLETNSISGKFSGSNYYRP